MVQTPEEIVGAWIHFANGDYSKQDLLHNHFKEVLKKHVHIHNEALPMGIMLEIKHDAITGTLDETFIDPEKVKLNGQDILGKYHELCTYLGNLANKKALTLRKETIARAWADFANGDHSKQELLHKHFDEVLKKLVFLDEGALSIDEILDIKHDAIADTLKGLFEHPEKVKLNDQELQDKYHQLRGYLKKIAENKGKTLRAKLTRRQWFLLDLEDLSELQNQDELIEETVTEKITDEQKKQWLSRVIKEELSEEQRIVVSFRIMGGSFNEIASALNINVNAAQDRWRRALKKFRHQAGKDGLI